MAQRNFSSKDIGQPDLIKNKRSHVHPGSGQTSTSVQGTSQSFLIPPDQLGSIPSTLRPDSQSRDKTPFIAASVDNLGKGGGGFRSIDEKFSVNPANGTMSLTIPLSISKSRSEFGPSLSLSYDSGFGNGVFGIGWCLSEEAITRQLSHRLPTYAESDVFVLSGQEDLVPVHGGSEMKVEKLSGAKFSVKTYRSRIESERLRVEQWTSYEDDSHVYWKTITADNTTKIFGSSSNSRISNKSSGHNRIFSWLISDCYDSAGNAIQYNYKVGDGDNSLDADTQGNNEQLHDHSNNRHLKSIKYGNQFPNRNLSDWDFVSTPENWLFEVLFDYGEHDIESGAKEMRKWRLRRDPFSRYSAGFEVRTSRLCQRLLMIHHFSEKLEVKNRVVSFVSFEYNETEHASFLRSVTSHGIVNDHGGYIAQSAPPLQFSYSSAPDPSSLQLISSEAPDLHNVPEGHKKYQPRWIDLNGEGAPGLLYQYPGGSWSYQRNENASTSIGAARLGELNFGAPVSLGAQPSLRGHHSVTFEDLDGNGKLDMVSVDESGKMLGFFERESSSGWRDFQPFTSIPNINRDRSHFTHIGLTGNGLLDIFQIDHYSEELIWYPSLGKEGFGAERRTQSCNAHPPWRSSTAFQDVATYLADMSGDGLADIVQASYNSVSYWPNLGYGRFGSEVIMRNAPVLDSPDQFNLSRLHMIDSDGTGTTDFLYLPPGGGLHLYCNQAGNSWGEMISLPTFPDPDHLSSVFATDLLGNGSSCICMSKVNARSGRSELCFINVRGDVKPHLLTQYTNGLGLRTVVEYQASTKFYLDDEREGTPWDTRLPFPVQCVRQVSIRDEVAQTEHVTSYRYHNGFFDGVGKEFRGFGAVDVYSEEDLAVGSSKSFKKPPTQKKFWYFTGSVEFGCEKSSRNRRVGHLKPKVPSGVSSHQTRELYRALKGLEYLQEICTVGGAGEGLLVTIENSYEVRPIQEAGYATAGITRIIPRETLTWHSEPGKFSDTRIEHELVLGVNDFGDVTRAVTINYGRNKAHAQKDLEHLAKDQSEKNLVLVENIISLQTQTIATLREYNFTTKVDTPENFRKPMVCATKEYRILGLPDSEELFDFDVLYGFDWNDFPLSVEEFDSNGMLRPEIDVGAKKKILVSESRTYYTADDPSSRLDHGDLKAFSLVYQKFDLTFSASLGSTIAARVLDSSDTDIEKLLSEGGYRKMDGSWWTPSSRETFLPNDANENIVKFSRSSFYMPNHMIDALGNESKVEFDEFNLFPIKKTDTAQNSNIFTYDYNHLQPSEFVDCNKNRQNFIYGGFGEVIGTATMGKANEPNGDSLDGFQLILTDGDLDEFIKDPSGEVSKRLLGNAGTRTIYALNQFHNSKNQGRPSPSFVAEISRQEDFRHGEDLKMMVKISYLSGTGAVLQEVELAYTDAPASRWRLSGQKVLDSSGNVVRTFHSSFAEHHEFRPQAELDLPSTILFFDALNRQVGSLEPDHCWSKTCYNSWSQVMFDAGDTVMLEDCSRDADISVYFQGIHSSYSQPSWHTTHSGTVGSPEATAAKKSEIYQNSPLTDYIDPTGRVVLSEKRNSDKIVSAHFTYDYGGNVSQQWDAMFRLSEQHRYDMLGRQVYTGYMDAGVTWYLPNCLGNMIISCNSRHTRKRIVYDSAARVIQIWVREGIHSHEMMVTKMEYGEGEESESLNNRGRAIAIYDQSGVHTKLSHDFRGNLCVSSRHLAVDYKSILDWKIPDQVPIMKVEESRTFFNAFSEPTLSTTPNGSQTAYRYNSAKMVESVSWRSKSSGEWTPYLRSAKYASDHQIEEVKYGNEIRIQFSYHYLTRKLARQVTLRAASKSTEVLQNCSFVYDCTGRMTYTTNEAEERVYYSNTIIDPCMEYTYDSLGQLIRTEGREQFNGQVLTAHDKMQQLRKGIVPGCPTQMTRYIEKYSYDIAGNMEMMEHEGADKALVQKWTRKFSHEAPSCLRSEDMSNRLTSTNLGPASEAFKYDNDAGLMGCMTTMPNFSSLSWDFENKLRSSSQQKNSKGIPETTWNVYDYTGSRVRKVTERARLADQDATILKETVYMAGYDVFTDYSGTGSANSIRRTVAIEASGLNVALIETTDNEGSLPLVRYQTGRGLETDDAMNIISYEEYSAFGTTTYIAWQKVEAPSRYRFASYERDKETGLYYCYARFYAPWLCRWTSTDPLGSVDGPNLYQYCSNDPVNFSDPDGTSGKGAKDMKLDDIPRIRRRKNNKKVNKEIADNPKVDNDSSQAHFLEQSMVEVGGNQGRAGRANKFKLATTEKQKTTAQPKHFRTMSPSKRNRKPNHNILAVEKPDRHRVQTKKAMKLEMKALEARIIEGQDTNSGLTRAAKVAKKQMATKDKQIEGLQDDLKTAKANKRKWVIGLGLGQLFVAIAGIAFSSYFASKCK